MSVREATKFGAGRGGQPVRLAANTTTNPAGLFWFAACVLGGLPLFWLGLTGLASEWARPEYSHGPIIPILSFYMYLREMRAVPPPVAPVTDRGPASR